MPMKKIITLLFVVMSWFSLNAQLAEPITFDEGFGDITWTVFANGANESPQDIVVVENTMKSELNNSDSVLSFTVHDDANQWVGMFTDDLGLIDFSGDNQKLAMLVYKSKISPLRMKVENSLNGGAVTEIPAENTKVDEWELVVFDFSAVAGKIYQRFVVFPDFPETRDGGTIAYLDNIGNFSSTTTVSRNYSGESLIIYPNPVENRMSVLFPGMTGLKVYDVLGKNVYNLSFTKTGNKVVELGQLPTGTYILAVETENGRFTSRFLKR